jgi:hypothetical protein
MIASTSEKSPKFIWWAKLNSLTELSSGKNQAQSTLVARAVKGSSRILFMITASYRANEDPARKLRRSEHIPSSLALSSTSLDHPQLHMWRSLEYWWLQINMLLRSAIG